MHAEIEPGDESIKHTLPCYLMHLSRLLSAASPDRPCTLENAKGRRGRFGRQSQ